jgi:hypothetical protein
MTRLRIIVGVSGVLLMFVTRIMELINFGRLVEQVNKTLPEDKHFMPFGWRQGAWDLYREYRRVYPNGKLVRREYWLNALSFAGLLIAAVTFGFFS